MSVLEYWNSLELELKMTRAMSQPHRTLNSMAFFIKPFFLFVKVTCMRYMFAWATGSCEGSLHIAKGKHFVTT